MTLSRYGAPRRNAQERLRSVIMRDERCAQTIQRLLDDLHGLLLSRKVGDDHVEGGHSGGTMVSRGADGKRRTL